MSTVTTTDQRVALTSIELDGNVRELDLAHVDNLAGSMALRGLIVPVTVRPASGERYVLVAGFHRHAAAVKLGWDDISVTVREDEGVTADRAAENVVRKQLSPLEEARAVRDMLAEGFTVDGAASVLGWSRNLVTQRAKILELTEAAQALIGTREIPVGAVDSLLRINAVAPPLVEALAKAIGDEQIAGGQLIGNLGWALGQAMRHCGSEAFAAYLNQVDIRTIESLRLGKKTEAALAEAETLHKALDAYAYGPPTIRFGEPEIDQARAAGVLIELEHAAPIICDRGVYRDLCKDAIARTVQELRTRKETRAAEQSELRAERNGSRRARARNSTPSTARSYASSAAARTTSTSTSARP